MRIAISLMVTVLLISGCATPPKREELPAPSTQKTFNLKEPLSIVGSNLIGSRVEFGALPGAYTSERESNDGTYYFGNGRSIWHTNESIQKTPRLLVGGVFIPKASGQLPTLFYVFEKEVVTTKNLDEYIQLRISQAAGTQATVAPSMGMGSAIVGNVIGGALIGAIIDSSVGELIKVADPMPATGVQKVEAAIRSASLPPENVPK